ncbi:MAG: cytochrome c oxidase subunit II [Chloroflexi bacterium]|nr:cytochrome c oxidase subunit II [Chloroflexota bacterium]
MRHFVIVGVLVVLVAVLTYAGLNSIGLMPVEASAQSVPIDWLWNLDVRVISFLFALIVVPITYSLIAFRRRKGDTTDAEHIEGNTPLEITWTVVPLIVVLIFAYLGAYTLAEIRVVDPSAAEIKVRAIQWAWSFQYPEGFTSKELHLPVNKQVVLKMESSDVIHSFWVPEFRIKQDVVPGRITEYRVTPILVGSYMARCAELCGASHAYMQAPVIVSSQADYDAWIASQKALAAAAAQTPAGRGEQLANTIGCRGCHTIDGSKLVGPSWQGLYGSPVTLSDGTTITANDAYLIESIANPSIKIVKGFETTTAMPKFDLTDAQIQDLVAYLATLK